MINFFMITNTLYLKKSMKYEFSGLSVVIHFHLLGSAVRKAGMSP